MLDWAMNTLRRLKFLVKVWPKCRLFPLAPPKNLLYIHIYIVTKVHSLAFVRVLPTIAPATPIKHYKPKIRVSFSGDECVYGMHFAGRLVREPLNECTLRFATHNLLTKSQYLVFYHMYLHICFLF